MYFLRGQLPWQGQKANSKKQKYDQILEKKVSTSTEMLCKNFPAEFRSYFDHVKALRFDDRPDYDYLKRLFRELFFRKGYTYDNMFDWEILAIEKMASQGLAGPALSLHHSHQQQEDEQQQQEYVAPRQHTPYGDEGEEEDDEGDFLRPTTSPALLPAPQRYQANYTQTNNLYQPPPSAPAPVIRQVANHGRGGKPTGPTHVSGVRY